MTTETSKRLRIFLISLIILQPQYAMSVWKFTLAGSSAVSSRQSITSGEVTFQGEPQSAVGFFGESLGISSAENKRNADAKLKDRVAIIKRTAQQIAMAAGKQLPMQFVRRARVVRRVS